MRRFAFDCIHTMYVLWAQPNQGAAAEIYSFTNEYISGTRRHFGKIMFAKSHKICTKVSSQLTLIVLQKNEIEVGRFFVAFLPSIISCLAMTKNANSIEKFIVLSFQKRFLFLNVNFKKYFTYKTSLKVHGRYIMARTLGKCF
jgi:hypothetical protein